jgi:hypothetical protein
MHQCYNPCDSRTFTLSIFQNIDDLGWSARVSDPLHCDTANLTAITLAVIENTDDLGWSARVLDPLRRDPADHHAGAGPHEPSSGPQVM